MHEEGTRVRISKGHNGLQNIHLPDLKFGARSEWQLSGLQLRHPSKVDDEPPQTGDTINTELYAIMLVYQAGIKTPYK